VKVVVICGPDNSSLKQSYGSTMSAVTINCISRCLAELPVLMGEHLVKISLIPRLKISLLPFNHRVSFLTFIVVVITSHLKILCHQQHLIDAFRFVVRVSVIQMLQIKS